MATQNINVVVLTGNLTKDPELRSLPSGVSVCQLRIASNTRRKDGQSGEWIDKPNYFDVTVWGKQAEIAAQYLARGRSVAVDGRLEWREWTDQQGNKRQNVAVVANSLQFLGGPRDENAAPASGGGAAAPAPAAAPAARVPLDDDIPF